jgi:hypothetical protein
MPSAPARKNRIRSATPHLFPPTPMCPLCRYPEKVQP